MKGRVICLALLALIMTLTIPTPATAAAKPGAKCSKVGIESVVGSKTFTCIKSGKKLIWNKGNSTSTKSLKFTERWNATGSSAIKTMTKVFPA
jgi:hypothetical protein